MINARFTLSCLLIATQTAVAVPSADAQSADTITQDDRYEAYLRVHTLVSGTYIRPHWLADGDRFWFATGTPDSTVIYEVDAKRNTKKELSDKARLNAMQEKAEDPLSLSSPDKQQSVFVQDNNLWLRNTAARAPKQLTDNGIADNAWSIADAAWSPDGAQLLVRQSDDRNVYHLPVINYSKPLEDVEWNVYARTGDSLEIPHLYVIDTRSGKQVKIAMGGSPQQYVYPLGWTPDGTAVIFMRMNRQGNDLTLLTADPYTGASSVILMEQQKTFVGGLDFIIDKWRRQFTLLKDGKRFIWMSERSGWRHLYLYDMRGKLIRQLTDGTFPVIQVVKVDEKNGWIYFTANAETNLYYTNLYRINLEGKNMQRLTSASGAHYIQFSPGGNYFLDTHSTTSEPPVVELRRANGQLLQVVRTADTSRLRRIGWNPPESFVVKAADGKTDLYGMLYKPYNFDPNKKYPVINVIYAGPFMTIVPNGFMPNSSLSIQAQALAQAGYITFLVDGRGTTERSKAFQDVVFNNIGRNEIPDQVAALRQLAEKRPYMDLTRVGVYGHSWGGYFTERAMLTAPDVYRVGVASSAGEVNEGAEIHEPYIGLPQNNKAVYDYAANNKLVANLKGKLLLIHGTSDVNAPFSATVRMIAALIKAGKPYDLLLLPLQTHFFEGTSEKYANEAIRRYFDKNLKP